VILSFCSHNERGAISAFNFVADLISLLTTAYSLVATSAGKKIRKTCKVVGLKNGQGKVRKKVWASPGIWLVGEWDFFGIYNRG